MTIIVINERTNSLNIILLLNEWIIILYLSKGQGYYGIMEFTKFLLRHIELFYFWKNMTEDTLLAWNWMINILLMIIYNFNFYLEPPWFLLKKFSLIRKKQFSSVTSRLKIIYLWVLLHNERLCHEQQLKFSLKMIVGWKRCISWWPHKI